MSITPKITNTSRISPLCSSINKNLLTPCRRIGLSRKRKTPNSVVQMLSENSPISSSDSLSAETTPVNYGKSVKKNEVSRSMEITSLSENSQFTKQKEIHLIESNFKSIDKKMPKKGLFQAYSEDLFESDLSHTSSNNLEQDLQVDFVKLATKMPSTEILTPQNMSPEDPISLEGKPHTMKISEDVTFQDNDFNNDFNITNKYNRNQKRQRNEDRKKVKRTLLVKKSESLIGKESEDTASMDPLNMTKECIVQLHKISENDINQQKNDNTSTESCNSKSVEMIDEEEYAFTSTPEQETSKKSDMLEKTKALEKIIEQQRQRLVDLKQASIYKKKHSIEELNELTSKWMTGCKSGLNDLLTQLQAHGPMDMTTLLQNLHIPRDIVTKLAL